MSTCTELTAALNAIATAIENMSPGGASGDQYDTRPNLDAIAYAISSCCENNPYIEPPPPVSTDVPGTEPPTEPPDGYSTVDEYLCAAGTLIAHHHANQLRQLGDLFTSPIVPVVLFLGVVASVLAWGVTAVVTVLSGVAFAAYSLAVQIAQEEGVSWFHSAAEWVEQHASCYAYGWRVGDGIDGKVSFVLARLEENSPPPFLTQFLETALFAMTGQLELITYGRQTSGDTEYPPEVLEHLGSDCYCGVESDVQLFDYTPTQGRLNWYIAALGYFTDNGNSAGYNLEIYDSVTIRGDSARHLDCRIKTRNSQSGWRKCLVRLQNLHVSTLTIVIADETLVNETIYLEPGQIVDVATTQIDCINTGNNGIKVTLLALDV